MSSNTSTFWFHMGLVLAMAHTGNTQMSHAFSPESAVQGVPLVAFQDTGAFTRIHPTKMAIGKDGKIYFNSSLGVVYRVDEHGVLEEVSVLPNAGGIPDDDFTIGITFDRAGNLYVSNITGVYAISARDLRPRTLEQPVANTKVVDIPGNLLFPMGLEADTRGHLYLADIFGGAIFKIDIDERQITPWFSHPDLLAPNVLPSNNLFGVGFGLTDLAIGNKGKYLYFGTQETHKIYRLGINPNGSAGALEELAHVPNLAFNGISFDRVGKKLYLAVPWENFENGIQVATDPVEVAGSIWVIDIQQLEIDHVATPVELIRDVDLGTAVDVVSGFHFGRGPEQADRLYVSDGSFDTFFWLNGNPGGTPFPPDETPESGIPFPLDTYHAAIRMIEVDK